MGGIKNVDTSKFRRAIWNYIQCIYGIRHDDYDYGEVNQVSSAFQILNRKFINWKIKKLFSAAGSSIEIIYKDSMLFPRTHYKKGLRQHSCSAAGQ